MNKSVRPRGLSKLRTALRKIVSVPKAEIDRRIANDKQAKKR
jgi:hypothetical protein